jgi:hypothetical protein
MSTHTVITWHGKPYIEVSDGLVPVVDAKRGFKAELSKATCRASVRKGIADDPERCHYATALKTERNLGVLDARVRKSFTYIRFEHRPNVFVKYANSPEIKAFIQAFDDAQGRAIHIGDSVTVDLRPVPESHRMGYKSGQSGSSKSTRPSRKRGYKTRTLVSTR